MDKIEFFDRMNKMISGKTNISEDFIEKYKDAENPIILYGGGHAAQYYIKYLTKRGVKISAIIDREKKDDIWGIPVYTLEDAIGIYDFKSSVFVISAPSLKDEIKEILLQYVDDNSIYFFEAELYEYYNTSYDRYKHFVEENIEQLFEVYDKLADAYSRETMLKVIEGRLTGNFDLLSRIWTGNQYWPEDIFRFTEKENIIECGSSDGRTLRELCTKLNDKYDHIYCFEPDAGCKDILLNTIQEIDQQGRITLFEKGTYKESTTLCFSNAEIESGLSKLDQCGETKIEVVAIDEVIREKVTYIKMDIEGAELDTLIGARRIIIENKPKLAVCIYHKDEDIINIVNYLQDLNVGYKFYIRHHNCNLTETVLYAI